MVKLVFLLGN